MILTSFRQTATPLNQKSFSKKSKSAQTLPAHVDQRVVSPEEFLRDYFGKYKYNPIRAKYTDDKPKWVTFDTPRA